MSKITVDAVEPSTGTSLTLGASGDTLTLPSGATLDIASGATIDATGATTTGFGGITHASRWRLTTSFTGTADPITSNFEVNDTSGYASLGSEMTESSGVFTFPGTGYWLIFAQSVWYRVSGGDRYTILQIKTTIDNGTWVETGGGLQMLPTESAAHYVTATNTYIFDVTDTSTHKVSFRASSEGGSSTLVGNSTQDQTCFTFIRLADT